MNTAVAIKSNLSTSWRMPTREECKQLFEGGAHRHCNYFNDLKYTSWTSSTCHKNANNAFFAYFAYGTTGSQRKTEKVGLRLVRDVTDDELFDAFNNIEGRFALTACKTAVIDRLTGIAWARRVIRPKRTWQDALDSASEQKS